MASRCRANCSAACRCCCARKSASLVLGVQTQVFTPVAWRLILIPNSPSIRLCWPKKLNGLLHHDIAVYSIEPVAADLHARFSAVSRTYRYYVHTRKDPFLCAYSLELHYQLDYALMNEAGRILMEYDDFGAFCKAGSDVKTTLCHVTHAQWHQTSPTTWYFEITANRFLRNMVRAVVGTLVEVGRGRMTLDDFRQVIEGKQRTQAGESMPAKALFLEDVSY